MLKKSTKQCKGHGLKYIHMQDTLGFAPPEIASEQFTPLTEVLTLSEGANASFRQLLDQQPGGTELTIHDQTVMVGAAKDGGEHPMVVEAVNYMTQLALQYNTRGIAFQKGADANHNTYIVFAYHPSIGSELALKLRDALMTAANDALSSKHGFSLPIPNR